MLNPNVLIPNGINIRFKNDIEPQNNINKNLVLEYAEILASGFKFVRIDFFEVNDQLYFGEYTFTPHSGFIGFNPDYYDSIWGDKLKLF